MAQVEWSVRGRLLLVPQLKEIAGLATVGTDDGKAVPLAGVAVKVSALEFGLDPTGWEEWDQGVTDKDGYFDIRKTKDQTNRRFRVSIQFKDAALKIYPPNDSLAKKLLDLVPILLPGGPIVQIGAVIAENVLEQLVEQTTRVLYDVKWYVVHEDDTGNKHGAGVVQLNNLAFKAGAMQDRGSFEPRRHAEIWWLVKAASARLASIGVPFRGDKTIAVLYPWDNPAVGDAIEESYSNPENNITFLLRNSKKDQFDADTILHELMHLWTFQHTEQEKRLVTYLFVKGTTHNGMVAPWAAWHEAFAEVTSNALYRDIFGTSATVYGAFQAERRPYSRKFLKDNKVRTAADLNVYEFGWQSVFGLLLCPDVVSLDMNGSGTYATDLTPGTQPPSAPNKPPKIELADLLAALGGENKDGGLRIDDMRTDRFLSTIKVKGFDSLMQAAFLAILDPAETRQPATLLPAPK